MTGGQLELFADASEAGYWSVKAQTRNRCAGTGHVAWYESEAAAKAAAVKSFDRGYRTWPEHLRPVAEVVEVELLLAGPDVGPWRDHPNRTTHADYPWFPDRKATA
jgi:hypothetical protein